MEEDIEDVMRRFTVLGTSDKDALISQFQALVGNEARQFVCEFFLEMANWNLQAALCAYYDTQTENAGPELKMVIVDSLEEGVELLVPARTTFRKGWRIRNSGTCVWPAGCCLRFAPGSSLRIVDDTPPPWSGSRYEPDASAKSFSEDRLAVPGVPAGNTYDVWATFESPSDPGAYRYELRVCTSAGVYFGECLLIALRVTQSAAHDEARFDVSLMRSSLIDAAQPMPVDDSDAALAQHINSLRLAEAAQCADSQHVESLALALSQQVITSAPPRTYEAHETSWTQHNQPDDHAA